MRVVSSSIFLLLSVYSLQAHTQVIQNPIFTHSTSDKFINSEVPAKYTFSCISADTGEPIPCTISAGVEGISDGPDVSNRLADSPDTSCSVMQGVSVPDLVNKGGHLEDEAQGELVMPNSNMQLLGNDSTVIDQSSGSDYYVSGPTSGDGYSTATVVYKTPEYAKVLKVLYQFDVAPEYVFVDGGARHLTKYIQSRQIILASDGFERMDGCGGGKALGQNYYLVVGNYGKHPEPHWGTPAAVDKAKLIANRYKRRYNLLMSYNDMSLPMGGKILPHKTHRNGKDVDVNTVVYTSTGANHTYLCNHFCSLDSVVNSVRTDLTPGSQSSPRFPTLDCYEETDMNPNGRIHINLVGGF